MFSTKRRRCLLTKTDSYKLQHWEMLPEGTTGNLAYFQSRVGARFDETVFVGLQYILQEYLAGAVVTEAQIDWMRKLTSAHLGFHARTNPMWERIRVENHGRLPLRIKAVPEGTPVPVNNALMVVENLVDYAPALTTAVESLLTHVWYPSTVATLSRETFKVIKEYMEKTGPSTAGYQFKLHDFGYRGVAGDEAAGIGGFGHLVNGLGTDTLQAIEIAHDFYHSPLESIAYSVPATEHSIMSALGPDGEASIIEKMINLYPAGILSVVADTFNYYRFVEEYICKRFKAAILNRKPAGNVNATFVIRPDSITPEHPTPEALVVWTLDTLWEHFGGTMTPKGYKLLDNHVRVLWGDGINKNGIETILHGALLAGYAADNMVFGMGGGLLQKVHRDMQRFAFKSAAQKRHGLWHPVFKHTIDPSKRSFDKGKMKLIRLMTERGPEWKTVAIDEYPTNEDQMVTVFENGNLTCLWTLNDLRKNAAL